MTISAKTKAIDERVALLLVLPRVALKVVAVAFREDLLRLRLEEIERLAERAAGERHAGQRRRIELLEARQRVRLHLARETVATADSGTSSPFAARNW